MVLKSKLNGKSKITPINAWAVAVLRYGAEILQWKENELKDVGRKSRNTMTIYGALVVENGSRSGALIYDPVVNQNIHSRNTLF